MIGDRLTDEVVGRGPEVVLVPGIASSAEIWASTVEPLWARFRLHVVRIGGFGGEPSRANGSGPPLSPLVEPSSRPHVTHAPGVDERIDPPTIVAAQGPRAGTGGFDR